MNDNQFFQYQLHGNIVFFTDTLSPNSPYISKKPRNHESLFFVTKGTLLYKKEGLTATVGEGQVGYIARGSVDQSSAYLCDEVSYIAVNFHIDRQTINPQRTLPFETLCSEGIAYNYEKQFKQALSCFLSKTPGYHVICTGIILQIIGQLYNEHSIKDADFTKMQRIEKAVEHLKQHYGNPDLQISNLANIVNMSEKHFRRLFSDIYHKTPYAFLQEFRINKAEILLLNTTKSISDIAQQCGFSDIYSFSHSFKKHNNVSPVEYRSLF